MKFGRLARAPNGSTLPPSRKILDRADTLDAISVVRCSVDFAMCCLTGDSVAKSFYGR